MQCIMQRPSPSPARKENSCHPIKILMTRALSASKLVRPGRRPARRPEKKPKGQPPKFGGRKNTLAGGAKYGTSPKNAYIPVGPQKHTVDGCPCTAPKFSPFGQTTQHPPARDRTSTRHQATLLYTRLRMSASRGCEQRNLVGPSNAFTGGGGGARDRPQRTVKAFRAPLYLVGDESGVPVPYFGLPTKVFLCHGKLEHSNSVEQAIVLNLRVCVCV